MTDQVSRSITAPLRFAATVLALAGVLNIIEGLFALAGDERFNVNALLFESLTAWGVVYIIIGLLLFFAAASIIQQKPRGLVMGIAFASISGCAHFMSLGAYPIWSVTVMVLNFAVLFALLTNDDLF